MEVCTAEKQMERRTACLQANVEFLQQALNKLAHAADRDLAAARAEIAALKSATEKLNSELKQMKVKAEPENKK